MSILRGSERWRWSRRLTEEILLQNALIWIVAVGLLLYCARGLTVIQLLSSLKRCHLALFLGANVGSVAIRWLADTYLYAKLFTFFHAPTSYAEVLPASTAQYFLQAVNVLVADAAMLVFLHQRKGVHWITATWTMAFQGFVDAILMATLTVVLAICFPWSPIHVALPYASTALVFFTAVSLWWMSGKAKTHIGHWLRSRPGMRAFRLARPYHYVLLGSIRLAIYVANVIAFYLYLESFRLHVSFTAVLALSPALVFAQSAPISPSGLGFLQVVMVKGLARFAPRDELLATGLGISVVQLLCRVPMGVGAAGTFARRVLAAGRAARTKKGQPNQPSEEMPSSQPQDSVES
jgi:hypothetical protein